MSLFSTPVVPHGNQGQQLKFVGSLGGTGSPAGLDDLLASVLTGEDEHPKERERLKGACDLQGMFLVMLNFGPKKKSRIWEVLMHY